MYQVEILDQDKGIISLHWEGKVTPDEVDSANEALKTAKQSGNQVEFQFDTFEQALEFLSQ